MVTSVHVLWDAAAISGLFAVLRRPGLTLMLIGPNVPFVDFRQAGQEMLTDEERDVIRDHAGLAPVSEDPECVSMLEQYQDQDSSVWCQDQISGLKVPPGFDLTRFLSGGYNQGLPGLSEAEGGEPRGSLTGAERKPQ